MISVKNEEICCRLTLARTTFICLLCAVVLIMIFSSIDHRQLTLNIAPSIAQIQNALNLSPQLGQMKNDISTKESPLNYNEENPIILFYNKPFWIGKDLYDLKNCPYKCEYTTDRRKWTKSAAVIFIMSQKPTVPRIKRAPGQVWVFFNLESPTTYRGGFQKWDDLFNWTMTYRLDSDVLYLNHGIIKKEAKGSDPFNNKTKTVNWLVSNCHTQSRRLEYAKLLKRYIPIDVYGRCGSIKVKCKGISDNKCWKDLFKSYFFYLSFENSFCRDYITEKAFNPLRNDIVPIMRGDAVYSKYFPVSSYINTADYKNVKELADFLKNLTQNEAEYDAYFDWRKHYVAKLYCCQPKSFCELCRRLNYKDENVYWRRYGSVHDWWHKGGNCKTKDDLHRRR